MATSKKGGVLILDFKNEPTFDADTEYHLKSDFNNKIRNTKGKQIIAINLSEEVNGHGRDEILYLNAYIGNDIITLSLTENSVGNFVLNITKDNILTITE